MNRKRAAALVAGLGSLTLAIAGCGAGNPGNSTSNDNNAAGVIVGTTDKVVSIDPAGSRTVADTLRRALDEQPAGVFTDFNPADRIADRPVVSYREVRGGRDIGWAVFADKTVRIAIGCQGPPGHGRAPCEAAIRTAHAVL